jgi:hypothetical protein
MLLIIKSCVGLSKVSLKEARSSLQKIITWIKKPRKGKQEWKEFCIIVRLFIKMLRILMKT